MSMTKFMFLSSMFSWCHIPCPKDVDDTLTDSGERKNVFFHFNVKHSLQNHHNLCIINIQLNISIKYEKSKIMGSIRRYVCPVVGCQAWRLSLETHPGYWVSLALKEDWHAPLSVWTALATKHSLYTSSGI